jgi:erythromycin esterase-like protein
MWRNTVVLEFLDKADPEAAKHARERYGCFERFGPDDQVYGFLAASGATPSCKEQVIEQLMRPGTCATGT